jgi:hypothetical protein
MLMYADAKTRVVSIYLFIAHGISPYPTAVGLHETFQMLRMNIRPDTKGAQRE